MSARYYLRYRSDVFPVRIAVNGFYLINDTDGQSANVRLEPYLRAGSNHLRLEADPGATGPLRLLVLRIDADGTGEETLLAALALPDPAITDGGLEREFTVSGLPPWRWERFDPLPDNLAAQHTRLAELARLLRADPDGALPRLLDLKHTEIGAALGLGRAAMDQGLGAGLAKLRSQPGFAVDLVPLADYRPWRVPGGGLVRAMRADGGDAIQMNVGGDWHGFEVTLGEDRGQIQIIR